MNNFEGFKKLLAKLAKYKKESPPVIDYTQESKGISMPDEHVKKIAQDQKSLIEKATDYQRKLEALRYQVAEQTAKASEIATRKSNIDERVLETNKYLAYSDYPTVGDMFKDSSGNYYRVICNVESLTNGVREVKILPLHYSIDKLVIYWVRSKLDKDANFAVLQQWPDPDLPVMFVYVYEENLIYAGKYNPTGHTHWVEVGDLISFNTTTGAVNQVLNYLDNPIGQKDYEVPRQLEGEAKDKFDSFLNTVKLRAEIVKDVEVRIKKGDYFPPADFSDPGPLN